MRAPSPVLRYFAASRAVSVETDDAVAEFGGDIRRLRPTVRIDGVDGMDETTWEGVTLTISRAIIALDSLLGQWPMTTLDPDTITRDPAVLKDIGRWFGGRLALNAAVARDGAAAVGDVVGLKRAARASMVVHAFLPSYTICLTPYSRQSRRHIFFGG